MSHAPDLVVPLAGFRSWRLANGRLLSPYIPCRWEGRMLHAECWDANRTLLHGQGWLTEPHESPHPDCQCGIYAYERPGLRTYYGESWWAEGVISAWGRIVVHGDGWRAQHARIEALALPGEEEPRLVEALEGVAARLGVPLVARAELQAVADAAGTGVPAVLKPGDR
jgi:hypothetical protein